ncbi:MAG: MerR family transcriptional regulator [Rhodospirillaceae bacterium]|nr:MerR family transcriptional regulator [Rhodospirillaceae bacterium]
MSELRSDPYDAIDDRPAKSDAAFRTISEVAADLDLPQHVLRFWETKFPQIKPLKRGGGRRYYRPDDVTLLKRIKHLLYVDGLTIKGVQRILRDPAAAAQLPLAPQPDVSPPTPTPTLLGREDVVRMVAELTALRDDLRAALNVSRG